MYIVSIVSSHHTCVCGDDDDDDGQQRILFDSPDPEPFVWLSIMRFDTIQTVNQFVSRTIFIDAVYACARARQSSTTPVLLNRFSIIIQARAHTLPEYDVQSNTLLRSCVFFSNNTFFFILIGLV